MVSRVKYIFSQDIDSGWAIQDDQIIFFLERFEDEFKLLLSTFLPVKGDIEIAMGEIGRQQVQILIIRAFDAPIDLFSPGYQTLGLSFGLTRK